MYRTLLHVSLETLGQRVVDNEAHVRLINTHPERHRRAYNAYTVAHPILLHLAPPIRVELGVVVSGVDAILAQLLRVMGAT